MSEPRRPNTPRRRGGGVLARLAPVVWIAVLLAFWLLMVEWKMLPELVSATFDTLS